MLCQCFLSAGTEKLSGLRAKMDAITYRSILGGNLIQCPRDFRLGRVYVSLLRNMLCCLPCGRNISREGINLLCRLYDGSISAYVAGEIASQYFTYSKSKLILT